MKGTIRERVKKDGSTVYTCQVEAGRDPATNKRRYRTATAPTRRDANSLLHELMKEIDGEVGRVEEGTTMTLGALIERWLELGGPAAASTRQVYAGYIKNQIKPHLWDVRLDRLKVADLDRWYLMLRESGLKPASIRKAHTIVRAALSQGARWGWVPVNVAALAKPPTVAKPVIATPTAQAVKRLVEFIAPEDRDFATYVRVSGVTGARPGEVCALQWHDIDLVSGDMHVRRRIMRSESGTYPEDLTKTGKTRKIPLDSSTLRWVREHRAVCDARAEEAGVRLAPESFIFASSVDGRSFWRPDVVSRRFRYFREKAGMGAVPLYALRHQAATTMIDAGVDAKTASDRLGNSVATILSTYTRGRTEADVAAANLLGNLYD